MVLAARASSCGSLSATRDAREVTLREELDFLRALPRDREDAVRRAALDAVPHPVRGAGRPRAEPPAAAARRERDPPRHRARLGGGPRRGERDARGRAPPPARDGRRARPRPRAGRRGHRAHEHARTPPPPLRRRLLPLLRKRAGWRFRDLPLVPARRRARGSGHATRTRRRPRTASSRAFLPRARPAVPPRASGPRSRDAERSRPRFGAMTRPLPLLAFRRRRALRLERARGGGARCSGRLRIRRCRPAGRGAGRRTPWRSRSGRRRSGSGRPAGSARTGRNAPHGWCGVPAASRGGPGRGTAATSSRAGSGRRRRGRRDRPHAPRGRRPAPLADGPRHGPAPRLPVYTVSRSGIWKVEPDRVVSRVGDERWWDGCGTRNHCRESVSVRLAIASAEKPPASETTARPLRITE